MSLPCPHCGFTGPSLDKGTCGRCGVVFSHIHPTPKPLPPEASVAHGPPEEAPPPAEKLRPPPSSSPTENRWALPLAFGVAFVLNSNGCGRLVVFSTASNWSHELGHASWRWLNGRSAVPALFFTFYSEPGRSVVFSLLVLGGLVALLLWARKAECPGLMSLAALFLCIFIAFAIAMPSAKEHLLESFAGLFGEFWISTLWVVLFYYRFPSAVRWKQLRWVFLFLGAAAYTRILAIFLASRADISRLPWGSFYGGDGDLDRLLAAGWLVPFIREVYFRTAAICGAVMALHYAYFLLHRETPDGNQGGQEVDGN